MSVTIRRVARTTTVDRCGHCMRRSIIAEACPCAALDGASGRERDVGVRRGKTNEFSSMCGVMSGAGWNFEVGAITIRPRNRGHGHCPDLGQPVMQSVFVACDKETLCP